MAKVAINGLGRIGRAAFKIVLGTPSLELMAVNDIVPVENLAYLLKYDTVYGRHASKVEAVRDTLMVGDRHHSSPSPVCRKIRRCRGAWTGSGRLAG